ncbi:MAG: methylated-DNA--[protein]-cysteine S-methyltransferase [Bdellovibrio sp.]|nr:methylated-DNA--[protein]-cysteine S-methyltransferase [Bdellovibrio sp.]
MELKQYKHSSAVGAMYLVASEENLFGVFWNKQDKISMVANPQNKILQMTLAQLEEYFEGTRTEFSIPLSPQGTEFQLKVWKQLQKIPYGKTISYKELATAVSDPNASRAVGSANGKNPISIIIPCHRVIASNGRLAGYAGGVSAKDFLLKLESQNS